MSEATAAINADQRAAELFATRIDELPPLAVGYAKHLFMKTGACAEVAISAYRKYAQVVEGLPCDEPLYHPDDECRAWFAAAAT